MSDALWRRAAAGGSTVESGPRALRSQACQPPPAWPAAAGRPITAMDRDSLSDIVRHDADGSLRALRAHNSREVTVTVVWLPARRAC